MRVDPDGLFILMVLCVAIGFAFGWVCCAYRWRKRAPGVKVARDGQPCPNTHDPDCRWPECNCRTTGVTGLHNDQPKEPK